MENGKWKTISGPKNSIGGDINHKRSNKTRGEGIARKKKHALSPAMCVRWHDVMYVRVCVCAQWNRQRHRRNRRGVEEGRGASCLCPHPRPSLPASSQTRFSWHRGIGTGVEIQAHETSEECIFENKGTAAHLSTEGKLFRIHTSRYRMPEIVHARRRTYDWDVRCEIILKRII